MKEPLKSAAQREQVGITALAKQSPVLSTDGNGTAVALPVLTETWLQKRASDNFAKLRGC